MIEEFEKRIEAIQKIKAQFFPDLYFQNFKTGNPLELSLDGRTVKEIRFTLNAPGIISLGSLRIFENGQKKEIDLVSLSEVEQSSYHIKNPQTRSKSLNFFLEGQATNATVYTDPEAAPWVIIRLKKSFRIERIIVNNCEGEAALNSWGLRVGVKYDEGEFTTIYDHSIRETEFARSIGSDNFSDLARSEKYIEAFECLDVGVLLALRRDFKRLSDFFKLKGKSLGTEVQNHLKDVISNRLLIDFKRMWTKHGIRRSFAFWSHEEKVKHIREANDIISTLEELTKHVCFGFGSALACHRDKDLIPHDDDIDILVAFNEHEVSNYENGLKTLRGFFVQRGYSFTPWGRSFGKVHKNGGRPVDVFVGIINSSLTVRWFPGPPKGMDSQRIFPPVESELLGEKFPIPADPEYYLSQLYGPSWNKPEPYHEHDWNYKRFSETSRET